MFLTDCECQIGHNLCQCKLGQCLFVSAPSPKKLKTLPYSYNYLREELGIKEEKEVSYTFEDYNIRNPEISAGSVIWELHCLGIREGIIKRGCSNIKVVGLVWSRVWYLKWRFSHQGISTQEELPRAKKLLNWGRLAQFPQHRISKAMNSTSLPLDTCVSNLSRYSRKMLKLYSKANSPN